MFKDYYLNSFEQQIIDIDPLNKLYKFFVGFFLLIFLPYSGATYAAGNCSPYLGQASLNEFFKDRSNMAYDADDFVEIKILNNTVTSVIFDNWTIQICEENDTGNNNDADGCSGPILLSAFINDPLIPWKVLKGDIGRYINFKTGFDAILLDSNNDVVDYVSVDGVTQLEESACTGSPPLYPYQTSAPGASDKFIFRTPDGTGPWGSAPSASAPPSEEDTNDTDPNGDPAPIISVADVTVDEGNTAIFTFNLADAPKTYDVSVTYETNGGTAVAGTDYTYTTGTATIYGTATIPAGQTSISISVPTISGSPSGITFFYLELSNPVNSTIINNFPTGTIIPITTAASAEWYMDESSWNDQANEVVDNSGNNNHGTPYSGLNTTPGYLCNGGNFNGFSHYIDVPDAASLNGSTDLTYSAWINPDSWAGNFIVGANRQIMGKSVHEANAQMGIFSEGGVLKGRAETLAGQYEVSTTLPPTGAWTHVALVFSQTELRLYINGNLTGFNTFATTSLVPTTDPLTIGRRYKTGFLSFLGAYNFDGIIDETLVFQAALPASFIAQMYSNYTSTLNWDGTIRACPGILHHIEFVHDGSALTCNPEQITIKACANSDCSVLSTSSTTVGLLPTGWVGGESLTFTGSASYSLQHTTAETVTLSTSSITPIPISPLVFCKTITGTVIDPCTMAFNKSGFIFDVTTQTSCVTSSNITISAVKDDPTDPEQCIPFFANKNNLTLNFWTDYSSPATGTKQATLNYSGTDYPLTTFSPGTNVNNISFDSNGEATFTLNYSDAGELNLNATYTGSITTSDDGLSMSGNKLYVTKPAKFYVYSDDVNAACVSNDGTCSAFKPAGNDTASQFNLKVRAACADNTKTPNFILNNIDIALTNTAPAVNQGNIGAANFNIVDADAGEHIITNQAVSEVGVFTFTASLLGSTNYFGETTIGTPALNTSTYIGRFYPHHFDTTVAQSCDTFTYSGQPFTVTATAQNNWLPTPTATQNYTDTFSYETTLSNGAISPIINFYDASQTPADTNEISAASFFNGTATKPDVIYTFPNKNTPPETITLRANDADTAAIPSVGLVEGTTEIRSGRTRVENAYGSELVDMAIPAQVEFYNTNGFEINTADTCSVITATLTDIGTDLVGVGTGITSETCIWDDDGESGTNNCTNPAILPGPVTSQFEEQPPVVGSFNLFLLAPDANNTGDIGVTLVSPTWLQYDWDGDGSDDNDPTGIASFGLYRGDDRIIYWREVFQ